MYLQKHITKSLAWFTTTGIKLICCALIVAMAPNALHAQTFAPTLLKNLMIPEFTPLPSNAIEVNGALYFTTSNTNFDDVLWKSDGTANGTTVVKTIENISSSSFRNVDGTLFFLGRGTLASEFGLWKSDGTAAGTVAVFEDSSVSNFTLFDAVGSVLFFKAFDSVNGSELWRSDGTTVGTHIVTNIAPGSTSSGIISESVVYNEALYFAATDQVSGHELWKSDGSAIGTVKVKEIRAGSSGSFPKTFVELNGALLFYASDGGPGFGLWKTDGTEVGTQIVKSGISIDSSPGSAIGNLHYFRANEFGVSGSELWVTDGTTAGTKIVKDIVPGPDSSQPGRLKNVNGTLFFAVSDQGQGNSILWKSDGTEQGTQEVLDIGSNTSSHGLSNFTSHNGELFFRGTLRIDNKNESFLFRSNGTAAGTERLPGKGANESFDSPSLIKIIGGELILFGSNDNLFGGMFGLTELIQVDASVDSNGVLDFNSRGALPGGVASFTVSPKEGFTTDPVVGGTCAAGSFSEDVYSTGAINAPCSVSFTHSLITYTVTANVDANGFLDKTTAVVNEDDPVSFVVTANAGFMTDQEVSGNCDSGSFNGNTYTIDEVYEDCTISFTHSVEQFEVEVNGQKNGTVSPVGTVLVDSNTSLEIQIIPDSGYEAGVSSTCGGVLNGMTFTTNAVQQDCSVDVIFSRQMFLVDVSADFAMGSVTPQSQIIDSGDTTSVDIVPNEGINVNSVSGCGGVWSGMSPYETGAITTKCTITVDFSDPDAPLDTDCDFYTIPIAGKSVIILCI